jgi:hypothetical protein
MQIRHGIGFFATDFVDAANIDPDLDGEIFLSHNLLEGVRDLNSGLFEYLQNQ